MALFKISKGKSTDLESKVPYANEGYVYFTTDESKFYIDVDGKGDSKSPAVIGTNRLPLNAENASLYYGETSESTTEMTATIRGIASYSVGLTVLLKMGASPNAGCTININNLGAKELRWKNQLSGTYFTRDATYLFVYDGTYFTAIHSYATDTKNTAGSTNNSSDKLFIVGAPSQATSTQTYSRDGVYIDADGSIHAKEFIGDSSGLKNKLIFGDTSNPLYEYDGSEQVVVPIYDGTKV